MKWKNIKLNQEQKNKLILISIFGIIFIIVSIIISKSKTELEQKLEWFTYKGSGAILKAYKFLYDNNLLHEYEKSNYLALNNMEYPPDLASGLIERAILFKREDLIPTIKENIKRRN